MTEKSLSRVWRGQLGSARLGLVGLCAAAALGVLAFLLFGRTGDRSPERTPKLDRVESARPVSPTPEPNLVKPLTPDEAFRQNLLVAAVQGPIETAPAFIFPSGASFDPSRRKAIDCLTAAVYYEAGGESSQGKRAVAQVVLNRVRHPAYPATVCGVVYQGSERATGCQFTFTCDGSLRRAASAAGWLIARGIAEAALAGGTEPSVGTATHFHTVWVVPYWASSLQKLTTVGAHIFYRYPGFWGRRSALSGTYVGELSVADDPLGLDSTIADEIIDEPGDIAPTLPGPGTLLPFEGRLAAPDENPLLREDEDRGELIVDENLAPLAGP